MNEVQELIRKLAMDPKGKELLAGAKEPETIREVADMYLGFAKELGIEVSREEILAFMRQKEKAQQAASEKAEKAVKVALEEQDLEKVAGGAECADTYQEGEMCWFTDSCSIIIKSYSGSGESAKDESAKDADLWFYHVDDGWLEVSRDAPAGAEDCPTNWFE